MLVSEAAHIDDRITHTPQAGVDAISRRLRNFLEAHVLIEAHKNHVALRLGQRLHEAAHILERLGIDKFRLGIRFYDIYVVENVTLFVIRVGEQLRAGLPSIEELYKSKKCGNLCAVINDSDRKARSYGYGYGGDGSYSYSYQYGYGHHKKKKGWKFWKK